MFTAAVIYTIDAVGLGRTNDMQSLFGAVANDPYDYAGVGDSLDGVIDTFYGEVGQHIVDLYLLLEKYRDGFVVGGEKEGPTTLSHRSARDQAAPRSGCGRPVPYQ
jgi:hypothetical protein